MILFVSNRSGWAWFLGWAANTSDNCLPANFICGLYSSNCLNIPLYDSKHKRCHTEHIGRAKHQLAIPLKAFHLFGQIGVGNGFGDCVGCVPHSFEMADDLGVVLDEC